MAGKSWLNRILFGGYEPRHLAPDLALTALRVFTGLAMALGHGLGKVTNPEGIPGRAAGVGFPEMLHFPLGWAAALSEFLGGLLLALGLLTRPAAFFILCTMTVATYSHIVVRDDPFGGFERAMLFWFIAFTFIFLGSGRVGIDRFLRPRTAA